MSTPTQTPTTTPDRFAHAFRLELVGHDGTFAYRFDDPAEVVRMLRRVARSHGRRAAAKVARVVSIVEVAL